jgi:hypothetical protein
MNHRCASAFSRFVFALLGVVAAAAQTRSAPAFTPGDVWRDSAGRPINALAPEKIIERPKVIYNARTNKFVLWFLSRPRSRGRANGARHDAFRR